MVKLALSHRRAVTNRLHENAGSFSMHAKGATCLLIEGASPERAVYDLLLHADGNAPCRRRLRTGTAPGEDGPPGGMLLRRLRGAGARLSAAQQSAGKQEQKQMSDGQQALHVLFHTFQSRMSAQVDGHSRDK